MIDTTIPAGFRYRSGYEDYICPEGNAPERTIVEIEAGVEERKFFYKLDDCKNCSRRPECCPNRQKMVLKVKRDVDLKSRTGVRTPRELFLRYPMGIAVQGFIDFRYNEDGFLIASVKNAVFHVGEMQSECEKLWDYISRLRIAYTDGSCKDGHISSSYVLFDCFNRVEQRTVCARTNETVLDSELIAATMAVEDATKCNVSYLEIRADNKTVVDLATGALRPKSRCPNAFEFVDALKRAKKSGVQISVAKVQGHSGDVGNDLADFAAGSVRRMHPARISDIWKISNVNGIFSVSDKNPEGTSGKDDFADDPLFSKTSGTKDVHETPSIGNNLDESLLSSDLTYPEGKELAESGTKDSVGEINKDSQMLVDAPVLARKSKKTYVCRFSDVWIQIIKDSAAAATKSGKTINQIIGQKYEGFETESDAELHGYKKNPALT